MSKPVLAKVPEAKALWKLLTDSKQWLSEWRIQRYISSLQEHGLKLGKNFEPYGPFSIDRDHAYLVEIGDDVKFSPDVLIYTHDSLMFRDLNYYELKRVVIGDRVGIGARSTVLPGVTIGNDSLIGANSVVTRDIPPGVLAAGNPARVLGSVADYFQKHRDQFAVSPHWSNEWRRTGFVPEADQQAQIEALKRGEHVYAG